MQHPTTRRQGKPPHKCLESDVNDFYPHAPSTHVTLWYMWQDLDRFEATALTLETEDVKAHVQTKINTLRKDVTELYESVSQFLEKRK